MNNDLVKLLSGIANLKVVAIGEAMLDCYLTGFSDRMSPEVPVPVVTVTQQQQVPGGAANTAINVRALGGCVTFLSVIGDDWEGTILQKALAENGVSTQHILTQPGRQTLTKQRLMAGSQMLVRFDRGSTEAIDSNSEQALIEQLTSCFADLDALIVSDYGYGILTPGVIAAIAQLQHAQKRILVVDSKNLSAYRSLNVTAVKPNYDRAIHLLGLETALTPSSRADLIAAHTEKLLHLTGAQIVAVTLDAEGAIVFDRQSSHRTTTVKANPARTSGAGDTYVSALTLALAAKATMPAAADLAAAAASVVVGKDGTRPCFVQELREFLFDGERGRGGEGENRTTSDERLATSVFPFTPSPHLPLTIPLASNDKIISNLKELSDRTASYRAADRRIIFTNGCFDILHAGHVSYLNRARALGDILIVGVNSDASVSRLKGSTRPINPLPDRIEVLAALACVDGAIAFEEDTPINLIRLIRPDIYVKGGDYTKETLPEALIVEDNGGIVEIIPFIENRSTTRIIQRICQQYKENG